MHLDRPRIKVDFNELIEKDFVLLSQTDERIDSEGNVVQLIAGEKVYIYEYNKYEDGEQELFVADGIVELNSTVTNKKAKWSCRIDGSGIVEKYNI
jgi:hypothetical protein